MNNNWTIGDSDLSLSFENYAAKIIIRHKELYVYYPLQVFEGGNPKLTLTFYSLSEAVNLAENELSKCNTDKEDNARLT